MAVELAACSKDTKHVGKNRSLLEVVSKNSSLFEVCKAGAADLAVVGIGAKV